MKKKLLIALALLLSLNSKAQISFEATPDYGRLQDITYDAVIKDKLYAVSNAGNHILVSVDNKTTWNLLYSFPNPKAQISQLKLLGNNAISFIVNLSDIPNQNGIYIYNLTSNSVSNYYAIPNAEDNPRIMSYDVSDILGTKVLLHDTYSDGGVTSEPRTKVFYTINSGSTWNTVYYNLDHDAVHVNNVAISPNNPDKLFITRSFGPENVDGGLFISEDGGTTWAEHLTGILLDPIAFNPTDSNDIIIGTGISGDLHPENLYRSTDGGATWQILSNDWHNIPGFNNINKIIFNPINPSIILVLEEDVVAVSNDNGQSWTNTVYVQDDTNSYYAGLNASFNPFVAGEVVISTPYYPQFSVDGGISLSQINIPFYNTVSVSAALYGSENHIYYGAQGGTIHKNISTGLFDSYEVSNAFAFNPPQHFPFADPLVPGRLFSFSGGGFFGGNFNISNDYGNTNLTLMNSYANDVRAIVVDPNNANVILVSFRNGEGSNLYRINFADLNAIENTEISTPGIDIEGLGNGVVTGIAISPSNSQLIYLVQRDKFYKSTDSGITWQEKSNGIVLEPNTIIWDMAINPFNENEFIIATDSGIFTSTDAGDNWMSTYSEGSVHKVKYSPFNAGLIAAGIRGVGALLYSLNNGSDWTVISSQQLHYIAAQAIDFTFDGTTIDAFIATTDLGLIRYQIINLPLGIDIPEVNENDLIIYPNPASDTMNLFLANNLNQIETVEVFAVTGQRIHFAKATSIDISTWSNGVYLVKVLTTNGKTCTRKVVKS
ncbi:VPS10 domain-containing protein [Flavobacterium sp.]|uniref:T9SS type A sorting domain-containing protein n=1 Tax=Flavobacterium sp. TaxID=239 RepID=UPI002B4AB218|nr:T9SS type A sorting domain-containing protein [Flavobacterium sp.]HLP64695.1 T9SS type A sorting domain-containing protein [Flavobacterium sp.]